MRAVVVAAILILAPAALPAQSTADLVARGQAARDARDLTAALTAFEAALAIDSLDATANWKAALSLVDIGKATPDSVRDPARDGLYARAEVLARRATLADPGSADAHFVLANAIGRASLTKSKKERVRRAVEIREEALKALSLDHRHDGAYHVLGRWNAEIMRLSSVERFVAKSFMGGKVLGQASWDEAVKYLERAVSLKPTWIYHRLDLAEVYVDRGQDADARQQLSAIPGLELADASDEQYKRDAAALLQRIEGMD
jgi:tetratricopeptide (TPR) repeat protein